MAIKLYDQGMEYARTLIRGGQVDRNDSGTWSQREPNAGEDDSFIAVNGWDIYGWWHLGVDYSLDLQTKQAYSFLYGDFEVVHRAGVIAAESRAAQYGHTDIQKAAKELLTLIDTGR